MKKQPVLVVGVRVGVIGLIALRRGPLRRLPVGYAVADVDLDGRLDLYVVGIGERTSGQKWIGRNDTNRNQLWHNDGQLRFTDITASSGTAGRGTSTLAAVFFDADNKNLIFAVEDGDGFALTPIYSEGDAGRFAVLELDDAGLAHVTFFQSSSAVSDTGPAPGDIVYGAQAADGSWSFEVVGQVNAQVLGFEDARRTVALQLVDRNPVVAFIDTETLSFAERGSNGWGTTLVAQADGDPFQVVGLAVDGAGEPHITYSTVTANGPLDGKIWYARRG